MPQNDLRNDARPHIAHLLDIAFDLAPESRLEARKVKLAHARRAAFVARRRLGLQSREDEKVWRRLGVRPGIALGEERHAHLVERPAAQRGKRLRRIGIADVHPCVARRAHAKVRRAVGVGKGAGVRGVGRDRPVVVGRRRRREEAARLRLRQACR